MSFERGRLPQIPTATLTVVNNQPANNATATLGYIKNPDCPLPGGQTSGVWTLRNGLNVQVATGTALAGTLTLPNLSLVATYGLGPFTLFYTVTDACGNSTTVSQTFTVTGVVLTATWLTSCGHLSNPPAVLYDGLSNAAAPNERLHQACNMNMTFGGVVLPATYTYQIYWGNQDQAGTTDPNVLGLTFMFSSDGGLTFPVTLNSPTQTVLPTTGWQVFNMAPGIPVNYIRFFSRLPETAGADPRLYELTLNGKVNNGVGFVV